MPFTVITMTSVPNSLRGDLTKWMQEIAVGVYVGNFNSRVREQLWQRVCDNLQKGEATLSYATRNEIGYTFDSCHTEQQAVDLDGITLVRYPIHQQSAEPGAKHGFSKAYQSHVIRQLERYGQGHKERQDKSPARPAFVLVDLETTGLDEEKNQIIEIGAVKIAGGRTDEFQRLIRTDAKLSSFITELTGITDQMLLAEGCDRREALQALAEFVKDLPLVGYNIKFDIKFLESEFHKIGLQWRAVKSIDLLSLVRKEKLFLDNYKLPTVLASYGINTEVPHRALGDVQLLAQLLTKLNKFEDELRRKG